MTARKEPEATPAQAEAEAATEYVEYMGTPEHGIEFYDRRVISVADAKAGWDIDLPEDLVWVKKNKGGTPRMLLEASQVPAEVRDLLLQDTAFQVTTK